MLLNKSINASLNDSDYQAKLEKYCSTESNIYAASLCLKTYKNNPQFIRFKNENNLLFEPYMAFGKKEINERIELLVHLVNLIWNNEMFV